MSGKPNDKMFKTMIKKYGSEEKARDWFRSIGQAGGLAKVPKGFALMPREKVVKAGAVGGSNSTRFGVKNGQGKRYKKW